jgi:DNA polymerase-4
MAQTVFFHVDLDAFYASVEQLDNPKLSGKAVVVGAQPGHRGVVSACSYEARRYGVRSAMPISEARRRCPHAVFLPVRMSRYKEVSHNVMQLFGAFSPVVQQISVDEAFLDMTGTTRVLGEPRTAAARLKERVQEETGLTISVGIGASRYIAKLASAFGKPDGLYEVPHGEEEQFVSQLRPSDLWGVGRKTLSRLEGLGVDSVQKLKRMRPEELRGFFGEAAGTFLYRVSRGQDPGIYQGEAHSHSVSNETTFEADVTDADAIAAALLELSHSVMFRVIAGGSVSNTVAVKFRHEDFRTRSAQRTFQRPIASAEQLYECARDLLFSKWDRKTALRLVGVGLQNVREQESSGEQAELFEEDRHARERKVEEAILGLQRKYGTAGVRKARLFEQKQNSQGPPAEDEGEDRTR